MKHIWKQAVCTAAAAALLLSSCSPLHTRETAFSTPSDPLTGQELLYPGERVAAVTIENTQDDSAQWGMGSAAVVLEALTQSGSAPSLCLVYPSVSSMPVVGPVAPGQDLYWRLLSGQQVIPVQRGCGVYTRNYMDYYNIHAVDALEVGRNGFVCDSGWTAAPAWRTSGRLLEEVLKELNISTGMNRAELSASSSDAESGSGSTPVLPALLPQQTEGRLPDADTADALEVTLDFQGQETTRFRYDPDLATYTMLHPDGSPRTDANTSAPVAFDNLLVLYSSSSLRDDSRTLDYDLTMGGGVWLNGGHLWHITWTQGTSSTFAFYDADGSPLHIKSGRSYIALLSSLTGEELTVTG